MIGNHSIIMWPAHIVRAYLIFLWWFFLSLIWLVRAFLAACCGLVISVATIAILVYFGGAIYLRSLPAFEVAAEFFVIAVIASCIGLLMGDVFFVHPIRRQ